jgi:hypothetical protein
LALCQRYCFELNNKTGSNTSNRYGLGFANATTAAQIQIKHPVTMRTTPSLLAVNIASTFLSDGIAGTVPTGASVTANISGPDLCCLSVLVSSGLTVHRPYFFEGATTANNQLIFSAEL